MPARYGAAVQKVTLLRSFRSAQGYQAWVGSNDLEDAEIGQ